MASPADTADIASRWRPLTSAEEIVAATRLEDAWRLLRRLVSDIETRMNTDPDLAEDVVQALSEAVLRVLRNPEGLRRGTVSIDDASRSFEYESGGDEALYFTEAQLARLRAVSDVGGARVFSVMPY